MIDPYDGMTADQLDRHFAGVLRHHRALLKYGGTLLIGVGLGVIACCYSVIWPHREWIAAEPHE